MHAWKAEVQVTLKKSVLDPQGVTVQKALSVLGYENVEHVRVGKYLELVLQAESELQAETQLQEMCRRLLTNPVIEDYTYRIKKINPERGKGG